MMRAARLAALLLAGCAPEQPDIIALRAFAAVDPPFVALGETPDAPAAPQARPVASPVGRPVEQAVERPVERRVAPPVAREDLPPEPAPRRARAAPAPRDGDALCGDPRLTGARVPEVTGSGQCGIVQPVRLSAVAGVRLTRPVTVGCEVARALADWTETVAKPAAQTVAGAPLQTMTPFAGYACRPTNSQIGARLSRHARGEAIDIGAFMLADGREVSVLNGWRGRDAGFLKAAWRGACGPFGTVLGPDADRWHRDHLHFDVAHYRGGPVCR